jgi:hypothetical protein
MSKRFLKHCHMRRFARKTEGGFAGGSMISGSNFRVGDTDHYMLKTGSPTVF